MPSIEKAATYLLLVQTKTTNLYVVEERGHNR